MIIKESSRHRPQVVVWWFVFCFVIGGLYLLYSFFQLLTLIQMPTGEIATHEPASERADAATIEPDHGGDCADLHDDCIRVGCVAARRSRAKPEKLLCHDEVRGRADGKVLRGPFESAQRHGFGQREAIITRLGAQVGRFGGVRARQLARDVFAIDA